MKQVPKRWLHRSIGMTCISAATVLAGCSVFETQVAGDHRPNVLVILVDDLGYSDIGAFGGEIETPHLNALVQDGRMLTNMHAGATCSPTRAMLLSGADHHLVGLGQMAEVTGVMAASGAGIIPGADKDKFRPFGHTVTISPDGFSGPDGYVGYLNNKALSMPEILRDSGYNTYMAGKWHLAYEPGVVQGGAFWKIHQESLPDRKGFERSFALLPGGGSHFAPVPGKPIPMDGVMYVDEGQLKPSNQLPADFYSSNYFTDRLIEYIGERKGERKPFFAYAAYTSPHWPLHAPDADIAKQRGKYDAGYEAIRAQRIAKMKSLGLLPQGFRENPGLLSESEGGTGKKRWKALTPEQQAYQARLMEVYAAMVHNLDANIGRLIEHLKSIGEYDNTMIVFMSDNGAEGSQHMRMAGSNSNIDNSINNIGKPLSMVEYGERWAEVSSTPFRLWKSHTGAEGGTSVPAIAKMPHQTSGRAMLTGLTHVTDILPTVLELTKVKNPGTEYKGRVVHPITGTSLVTALSRHEDTKAVRPASAVLADELFFNSYVKKGQWKLSRNQDVLDNGPLPGSPFVPLSSLPWKLYDMSNDRGETQDLAAKHPEIVADLLKEWNRYVADNKILMMDYTYGLPRNPEEP